MSGLQISCTIPMRGNAPIVPRRSAMFSHTFRGAHWACTLNILQLPGRCPKRSYECEAILVGFGLLHVELFLQTDAWEPNFCKSTPFMRSTRQRERKTCCHFGPYPHPIKFDFTRWETVVYIHLANSLDHDFMCPSLIFPIKKTGF